MIHNLLQIDLSKKASDIEAFVETYFIEPSGVVRSYLDKATRRFASDELFAGAKPHFSVPGVSLRDVYTHENCGMCTGAYMHAMTLKYRNTNEASALAAGKNCLDGLKHIYDLGKDYEEGFFPKIYGGRFSPQTSTDQVLYAVTAMDVFYDLADDDEKTLIEKMIPAMINFWVKHDYHVDYYNVKQMLWPLDRFPSLLLLASRYSNDPLFKREYERLLPLTDHTDCSRLRPKMEGKKTLSEREKEKNAYFIYHSADALTMATMQYDLLLRYDAENPMREKWLTALKQIWDESRLTLAHDGYYCSQGYIDIDSGEFTHSGGYAEDGSQIHCARSAWSTMIVRAAVQLADYFPEERQDIVEKLLCVLTQLGADDMLYYVTEDEMRFAPPERYKAHLLSGDAITNWLWAFHLAREKKLI